MGPGAALAHPLGEHFGWNGREPVGVTFELTANDLEKQLLNLLRDGPGG